MPKIISKIAYPHKMHAEHYIMHHLAQGDQFQHDPVICEQNLYTYFTHSSQDGDTEEIRAPMDIQSVKTMALYKYLYSICVGLWVLHIHS